jgi:hypothetical protein
VNSRLQAMTRQLHVAPAAEALVAATAAPWPAVVNSPRSHPVQLLTPVDGLAHTFGPNLRGGHDTAVVRRRRHRVLNPGKPNWPVVP